MSLHYHSIFEIHRTRYVSTGQHLLHPQQLTGPWLDGAYPDPDLRVVNLFVSETIGSTKAEGAARYCAFLCALFESVLGVLRHYDDSTTPLPEWWYQYLLDGSSITPGEEELYANNRQKLYGEAVRNHGAFFAKIQRLATPPSPKKRKKEPNTTSHEGTPTIWKAARDTVTKSAQQLQTRVEEISGKPLIVMYFDESHTLFANPLGDGSTRYAALCLALDHLSATTIFSLFLSTDSKLSRYAPPQNEVFSARLSEANKLQPPFTELSFDCHPSFPISQGQYTLGTSGELGFLCRFGRPLCVHMPSHYLHVPRCHF